MAVHFTSITCEPNKANRKIGGYIFFFANLFPVLTTLCMLGLKFLELSCAFFFFFFERFRDLFRALRIKGKCTSRHLFR